MNIAHAKFYDNTISRFGNRLKYVKKMLYIWPLHCRVWLGWG